MKLRRSKYSQPKTTTAILFERDTDAFIRTPVDCVRLSLILPLIKVTVSWSNKMISDFYTRVRY